MFRFKWQIVVGARIFAGNTPNLQSSTSCKIYHSFACIAKFVSLRGLELHESDPARSTQKPENKFLRYQRKISYFITFDHSLYCADSLFGADSLYYRLSAQYRLSAHLKVMTRKMYEITLKNKLSAQYKLFVQCAYSLYCADSLYCATNLFK